jgi:hypothetical protein
MPADKMVKTFFYAYSVLLCAENDLPCPRDTLASLGGKVVWLSVPNPLIRPRCKGLMHYHYNQKVKRVALFDLKDSQFESVLAEIRWLMDREQAQRYKGQTLLHHHQSYTRAMVRTTSDASGQTGAVSVAYGSASLHAVLPNLTGSRNVIVLEAIAPLMAWLRWGDLTPGALWLQAVDSMSVTYAGNSGRPKHEVLQDIMSILYHVADAATCQFAFLWLTRAANHTRDRVASCRDRTATINDPWAQCLGTYTGLLQLLQQLADGALGVPAAGLAAAGFCRATAWGSASTSGGSSSGADGAR